MKARWREQLIFVKYLQSRIFSVNYGNFIYIPSGVIRKTSSFQSFFFQFSKLNIFHGYSLHWLLVMSTTSNYILIYNCQRQAGIMQINTYLHKNNNDNIRLNHYFHLSLLEKTTILLYNNVGQYHQVGVALKLLFLQFQTRDRNRKLNVKNVRIVKVQ